MEDTLINFETAKLAKEKKFNTIINYYYDSFGDICSSNIKVNWNDSKELLTSAPTQSLLQKWLREVHNCFVEIGIHSPKNRSFTKKNLRYFVEINYYGEKFNLEMTDKEDHLKINIKTYEEALETGLQEALKLIK